MAKRYVGWGLVCIFFVLTAQADELDDLIARMTIREKLGQLKQATLYTREDVDKFLPIVRRGEVGSFIFNETLKREWRDELQRAALESRLKVPLSFADNIIHGWWTNFPIPLALACSFEPELFEKMAHLGAIEGRQAGLDWTFGPMCDTARDPRWGRVSEGTGEDPWLNGVYAAAQVKGFQGEDASATDRVAACLKHYCGYSSSTGGHDYNDSDFGAWTLRNLHLPPFHAAIKAGALSLMSGFNTYDGVPVLASREIMSDILREEWGFDRLIVTDYKSVEQTITWGVASTEAEAARRCLAAGNDIEMVSTTYDSLETEVTAGRVDVKLVDRSVKRVLAFKRAVGLFKHPMSVAKPTGEAWRRQTEQMQAFARECALKSVVLLKNDGVLPLKSDVRRIALIGPVSTDRRTMVGCWPGMESNDPETPESLADALKRELGESVELKVVSGCAINVKPAMIKGDDGVPMLNRSAPPADAAFAAEAAIAAAKACDAVVFALGEARDWTGENASRSLLTLTGRQQELFDVVTKAVPDKPVVTIVTCGRPLALPTIAERSSALFYAFHAGDGGPAALAELLTGKSSPSGRLTISVPYDVSQVPVYYNSYVTGRPTYGHYLDTPERGAMYPFGFGLSYSAFEYSKVRIDGGYVKALVTNTGAREAVETVQLYVHQRACAEGARPKRELRGFKRMTLKPGESAEVSFVLTSEVLGYVDRRGVMRCDEGVYDIWIAPDSIRGTRISYSVGF